MAQAGQWILSDQPVDINAGRRTLKMKVRNTGDRPIQIGSHFHFFEVNRAMDFDRPRSIGMHLNIPAGTSVRFEPGDEKEIELVDYGGMKRVIGFNALVNGSVQAKWTLKEALQRARDLEFGGMGQLDQEETEVIERRTKERQGRTQDTGQKLEGQDQGQAPLQVPSANQGKSQGKSQGKGQGKEQQS